MAPTTIRLSVVPTSTFTPFGGCNDETAVYPEAVIHTLDEERSEMWLCDQFLAEILAEVYRDVALRYAPRPTVLARCDGHAVGIIGPAGLRVEDASGREIIAT